MGFLQELGGPAIRDEIQAAPSLLLCIKLADSASRHMHANVRTAEIPFRIGAVTRGLRAAMLRITWVGHAAA